MKKITILGSTGSIGRQALDIIKQADRFEVYALSCHQNVSLLVEQAEVFAPKIIVIYDTSRYKELCERTAHLNVQILTGMAGLIEIATDDQVDVVLTSVVGSIGLLPTLEAIKKKKTIALANKETLVTAGELVMSLAKQHGATIIPVDSEHSAIFQCLQGNEKKAVSEILLTASGGPFRHMKKNEIALKLAKDALKHPNWSMGHKITIDSATLMNKGLEFIEAKWLFDVEPSQIKVLVHPQSIVHSMVRYHDQSVMAQLGMPDMRVPIIYALDYPERFPNTLESLDFTKLSALTFEAPDEDRFPCLKLAIDALKSGGNVPAILNASNEVLVEAYLKDRIKFYDIPDLIMETIQKIPRIDQPTIEALLSSDQEARLVSQKLMMKH
jgi:1-deoxy-D-xylulose-5-phosphate reductoisomerase